MDLRFLFIILYLSLFGGAIGVFAKMALSAFSPITVIFFRILISLLFFAAVFLWQKKLLSTVGRVIKNWRKFALLSLSCVGAAMIVGFFGLKYTSAIHFGLVYNLSAVFIVVFSVVLLKEKLSARDIAFILIAFLGAAVMATNGEFKIDLSGSYFFGDLLVLVSAAGWALYSVLGAKFSREKDPIDSQTANFGAFLMSLIFLIPAVIMLPSGGINFQSVNMNAILGLLGLSVLSTAGLFFLWIKFVNERGGVWATLVSLSEHLTGVILPIIFLNETLTPAMAIGGILMISSILGKELADKYKKPSGKNDTQ
jgi:drug/metabolite transporter (DMT)-like permease